MKENEALALNLVARQNLKMIEALLQMARVGQDLTMEIYPNDLEPWLPRLHQ